MNDESHTPSPRGEVAERSEVDGGNLQTLATIAIPLLLLTACDLPGCEPEPDDPEPTAAEQPDEPPHHNHSDPSPILDLTTPGDHPETTLSTRSVDQFTACYELFEPDGEPTDWPDGADDIDRTLFGCNAEGFEHLDDGGLTVAYEVPAPDADNDITDLRVVLFDDEGALQWHRRMDRTWKRDRFAARYRGSFLAPVGDHLVCTGTRWHQQTQLMCVRRDSGSVAWDGRVNMEPKTGFFGYDSSLFGADEDGISRRYPYSGAEMRHRSFAPSGGATSYLANDGRRIFYGPGEDHPAVQGWDLEVLDKIWSADLPDAPDRTFDEVAAGLGLVLLLVDETLLALDTDTGELRVGMHVGDATPITTYSDDTLFVFLRVDDQPLIYAIDPDEGIVQWVGEAPAATRALHHADGELLTRSVRTVRTVVP